MSASREKKNRQELAAQGYVDPKVIREAEEKAAQKKSKIIYGIIAAVFVIEEVKRVKGSLETMGFKRRFLSHFLFAVEKKVQTFRVKRLTTTPQSFCFAKIQLP